MTHERSRPLGFDRRVLLLALAAGFPATAVAMWLLWTGTLTPRLQWTLSVAVVGTWVGFSLLLRQYVVRPLQTLSNLLSALREGDFSIRGRETHIDEALGLAMIEINQIGELLQQQRRGAVEATALLEKVMEEIDVAVFAFDVNRRVQLVNRGGVRLLNRDVEEIVEQSAEELGLGQCLEGLPSQVLDLGLPNAPGSWEMRRGTFRQDGKPHQLIVLSDLTRTLRRQEREAWQRLIKVLRHEINNSLAPINSLADSLRRLVGRDPLPGDWQDDLNSGLKVISERSGGLSRFMSAYARLTQLPPPEVVAVQVGDWVRRVVALEHRTDVAIEDGPPITLMADGDQLDQLLINLVSNAVEAAAETGGDVTVRWAALPFGGQEFMLEVLDGGQGLAETQNLFVPFFTTKPDGNGIGLVLSRQIAENHGGTLTLENRVGAHGCCARLRLPLSA
ncbi:MAG: PAS domain-containing sensor histidine kinase [Acidobacteria bacterium]|nr:PAS domain-containing sensor histidine kinase [Acidobacteriota bacterium]